MRYASFQWLTRLMQLSGGATDYTVPGIAHVNLVNDMRFRTSREGAPLACHGSTLAAPGAGSHNFVELMGIDASNALPLNILHHFRAELGQTSVLTGVISWAVVDGSTLTTASRTPATVLMREPDPQITPMMFTGTILTANLPASRVNIPRSGSLGQTNASPLYSSSVTELYGKPEMPAAFWRGPSLMFFGGDNEFMTFLARWQCIRA